MQWVECTPAGRQCLHTTGPQPSCTRAGTPNAEGSALVQRMWCHAKPNAHEQGAIFGAPTSASLYLRLHKLLHEQLPHCTTAPYFPPARHSNVQPLQRTWPPLPTQHLSQIRPCVPGPPYLTPACRCLGNPGRLDYATRLLLIFATTGHLHMPHISATQLRKKPKH